MGGRVYSGPMEPAAASSFQFDGGALERLAAGLGDSFMCAEPFPHVVIDEFLPREVLEEVLECFPSPQAIPWRSYNVVEENKLACEDETKFPPRIRHLLRELNSSVFVSFLESLTGIRGLIADPHYRGGGLHQILPGGYLDVHIDFNWYERLRLDRRLNLIVYLNKNWKEEYGGCLELWDTEGAHCAKKVLPVFNRCVVFATTECSYHGHPQPVTGPPGLTRKSLALYYYSNGREDAPRVAAHTTRFIHSGLASGVPTKKRAAWKSILARTIPPILVDIARRLGRRHSGASKTPATKP